MWSHSRDIEVYACNAKDTAVGQEQITIEIEASFIQVRTASSQPPK